ncbi:MAG: family transporter, partial [Nocardioidaceae bacterium]|nr:family transporter [Nocardioidaceae bacterium]
MEDTSDEAAHARMTERFAGQWRVMRAQRRAEPPPVTAGRSNFAPAHVPYGVDLAAAWSWRLLIIAAATLGTLYLLSFFAVIVFPLIVALLITSLVAPVVSWLERIGVRRRVGALLTVVVIVGLVALLLTFVSSQIASGFSDLEKQVVDGISQIRDWLQTGPLKITDKDFQDALTSLQDRLSSSDTNVVGTLTELGATVGHVVAGFFIILFATYFFLADGALIWTWFVRLFPRVARGRADSSGAVAWFSLTQFVRATVIIAATDALGISIWAAVLQVPFVLAIGVLVFLGAFVPLIGASASGAVAVLVALVSHGWVAALLMLIGVVVIQQLEAHVLQPFLMGRFVSVHPLGVIVAIGCGVLVAGI